MCGKNASCMLVDLSVSSSQIYIWNLCMWHFKAVIFCGHYPVIVRWLKKLESRCLSALYLSSSWSSVSVWWNDARVISACLVSVRKPFCMNIKSSSSSSSKHCCFIIPCQKCWTALCQSGQEPGKLVKEGVTCSHFRRRRGGGVEGSQPACRVAYGILGLPILMWPLWSHF